MPPTLTDTRRPAATKRPGRLTLAKAAALCDMTPKQLATLLDQRANLIEASPPGRYTANPRPLPGDEVAWARDVFTMWAVRMGLSPYQGRRLIGYPGIAVMFGWVEQSVRAHISSNTSTFPPRVGAHDGFAGFALFDRAAVLEYATQAGICLPDGTPNLLKPHRGHPRKT